MIQKTKRRKWILGISIIAISVLGLSFMGLQGNSVYFYTPSEAVEKANTLQKVEIRVGGMVKGESVNWDRKSLQLGFTLSDLKGNEMQIAHVGTPPDMFKENSGVVVEGFISADGKSFVASKLMVKHSEEYRMPDGSHSMDRALLEKSLFKEEKL